MGAKLECCRLMKAAGDSLGTCFCHCDTMLRRRGLSVEQRQIPWLLVLPPSYMGDYIRSIGRTPIKTNFQPRSLAFASDFLLLVVVVPVGGGCPTPGLGEVKTFARDVERATQQLKELRTGRSHLKDSMGDPYLLGQNSTVTEVFQDMVQKSHPAPPMTQLDWLIIKK